MEEKAFDVIIIGGGPVGLVLASCLGSRGVRCALFDQRETTTAQPKCMVTNTRSMELLRTIGLADTLRNCKDGTPPDYPFNICWGFEPATGPLIAKMTYPSLKDVMEGRAGHKKFSSKISAELPVRLCQIFLEPLFREHAETYENVKIMFGWRVENIRQTEDRVEVTAVNIKDESDSVSYTARYAIGCDGATSVTRKLVGINREGQYKVDSYIGIFFESTELARLKKHGKAVLNFIFTEKFKGGLVSLDARKLYTLHMGTDLTNDKPDPDTIIRTMIGTDFDYKILDYNVWSGHLLIVDKFRVDNVFVAGDAAHLVNPLGAFGMNSGLGDAFDLAWKLEAILKGWGGKLLLDSYETERREFAEAVQAAVRRNVKNMKQLRRMPLHRFRSLFMVFPWLSSIGSSLIRMKKKHQFESQGLQLGFRYTKSPIIIPDGSTPPTMTVTNYIPNACPGSRTPHCFLEDGSPIYSHLENGFNLLCTSNGSRVQEDVAAFVSAARALGNIPMSTHVLVEPEVKRLYEKNMTLIRPDHHIAWRGDAIPELTNHSKSEAAAVVMKVVTGHMTCPDEWLSRYAFQKEKERPRKGRRALFFNVILVVAAVLLYRFFWI
ncbi:uncharacterized protein [Ptychodera flava]|uniref:uncharacterized protein n=1 Tax=Ptychodera flava TaxID=63121 RepID=UPI00396A74CF